MKLQGRIKVGATTKQLVNYLCYGDIAVIQHNDIDELAANALSDTGVKAVINTGESMTGRFDANGAKILLQGNLIVVDVKLPLGRFRDNDMVTIINSDIIVRNHLYKNVCKAVNWSYIAQKQLEARKNKNSEVIRFIDNTISFAADEMEKLISFNNYPELISKIGGRHVLVAARNTHSTEEITALKGYIDKQSPIFIGVDGGADLLVSCGYTPDILIGDMDSVSDIGIYKSREIILHAYENGYCPCFSRIAAMNVPYKILAMKGTSEDAALMLAYHKNAEMIVLVGGHSCMQDFTSKGRLGMASTFIARTLIGSRLIDCRGLGTIFTLDAEGKDALWAKV